MNLSLLFFSCKNRTKSGSNLSHQLKLYIGKCRSFLKRYRTSYFLLSSSTILSIHSINPSSSGVPTNFSNAYQSPDTVFSSFVSGICIVFSSNIDCTLFGEYHVASYSTSRILISVSRILRSFERPLSISVGSFHALSFSIFSALLAYWIEQDPRKFGFVIKSSILSSFQR